jgi:hypothetical protein
VTAVKQWLSDHRSMFILLLLLLFVHHPRSQEYIWDDALLIGLNPWKEDPTQLSWLWRNSLWARIPGEYSLQWYRPLMSTHILLDELVFGDWIAAKQTLSLLWFGTLLVLLRQWLHINKMASPFQTFWICLLVILHPFGLELTQFLSARNDSMMLVFSIGAGIVLALPATRSRRIGLLLLTFGALTSKESALLWLPLCLLPQYKKLRAQWFPIAMAYLLWFVLKIQADLEPLVMELNIHKSLGYWMTSPLWSLLPKSPLGLPSDDASFKILGSLTFLGMAMNTTKPLQKIGLCLFLLGSVLAIMSIQQSHSLGFRYAWLPMLGQIMWIVGTFSTSQKWIVIVFGVYFSFLNIESHNMWINNQNFWAKGYLDTPNQHTACGYFMSEREYSQNAIHLLKESIQTPPMVHCCAQASKYPLELKDTQLAIDIGRMAIVNGCPNIPELLAPLALAFTLQNDWSEALSYTEQYTSDPFGYKPVIEVAWGIKNNSDTALKHWIQLKSKDQPLSEQEYETQKAELRSHAEQLLDTVEERNQGL